MAAVTVAELVSRGTHQLGEAGVDSARFDASSLLAGVLKVELRHIPVLRNSPVAAEAEYLFATQLERRANREPLQFVIGNTEFYGLLFKCDARAMVPRAETETLVEAVIRQAHALSADAACRQPHEPPAPFTFLNRIRSSEPVIKTGATKVSGTRNKNWATEAPAALSPVQNTILALLCETQLPPLTGCGDGFSPAPP